jgi:hypothetical protein
MILQITGHCVYAFRAQSSVGVNACALLCEEGGGALSLLGFLVVLQMSVYSGSSSYQLGGREEGDLPAVVHT